MSKISFRFFNDRPVRAIWDEEHSKWWFSIPDVVGVLNAQDDYTKNRNYWKYLKNKLKADGNEVVGETNQLRLTAPDGKSKAKAYAFFESSLLDNNEVETLQRLGYNVILIARCLTIMRSRRSKAYCRFTPTSQRWSGVSLTALKSSANNNTEKITLQSYYGPHI